MHKLLHWGDQLNWTPIVCVVIASAGVFVMRMLTVWFFAQRFSSIKKSSEAETLRIAAELLASQKPIVPSVVSNLYFLSGVALIIVTLWGLVSTAWWMLPLGCLLWVLVHRPFFNEMQAWSQMQNNKMALEDAGISSDVIQKTIEEVIPINEPSDKKEDFQIINSKAGRFVLVDLSSGERILISIGSATVKVMNRSANAGWFAKAIASERLDAWQPDYWKLNSFYRQINRNMILEGLIISLSRCRSVDDVRRAWPTMQNPLLVVAKEKNF